MDIKITKGNYIRTVEVPINSLPAPSVANAMVIGFRNLTLDVSAITVADGKAQATADLNELFAAGLTNILNDAHASVKVTDSAFQSLVDTAVEKKLTALLSGTVRVGGGGGRIGDPIKRRAIQIAWARAKTALVKAGNAKPDDKQVRAKAISIVEGSPVYRHLAETQLAQEAALGIPEEVEIEADTDVE